jgi:hypothetical protein
MAPLPMRHRLQSDPGGLEGVCRYGFYVGDIECVDSVCFRAFKSMRFTQFWLPHGAKLAV